MHSSRLALAAAFLALPMLSHAQNSITESAPTPKYYVGLGAFTSNYQNLGRWWPGNTGFQVPMQLTAGYQLRPRLALEAGVVYSGRTSRYENEGYYSENGGTDLFYYQSTNTTTERITSVSALARYALTRQPTRRLQFEALGGFALMHRTFYLKNSEAREVSGTLQTNYSSYRSSSNNLLLTAGLGMRYRLSSRFALNFDIATNRNLFTPRVYGFTGSAALGVRYRFGK